MPGTGENLAVFCVRVGQAIAWAAVASVSLAVASIPAHAGEALSACPEAGVPFQTSHVSGVRDGMTLRLTDGREVRLAGVVAPSEIDGDPEALARAGSSLKTLVTGKRVALYGRADRNDRYGRLTAQVAFSEPEAGWIQAALVSDGVLRVAPEAGEIACAESLITLERSARTNLKGLWTEPRFSVVNADDLAVLNAALGRFAVVEGSVTRVGETSGHTYLDFGRRYTEDFTIVIPRQARPAFNAVGLDLKSLRGKRVRVRGVIFLSGGPAIVIRKPASLEIVTGSGT
jgi:endonuclease YncB( thermonuclease family)